MNLLHPFFDDKEEVLVIRIGNRYFANFGKAGRVQTAWSLAGATTYLHSQINCPQFHELIRKLGSKGKEPILLVLGTIGVEEVIV